MHKSVLLNESINYLNLKDNSIVVDCTLGYGGHSSEILKVIKNGHLYSFDQDSEAIQYSDKLLSKTGFNYTIINSNFENIKKELNRLGIEKVNGILYDLGVSSPQLDHDYRGFSFHKDSNLDMRMNQNQSFSAYNVVNEYSFTDLTRILKIYGEEKYANSIASNIIKNRPINTTLELVDIIKEATPMKYKVSHHPARKTFQAIRIEVNNELEVLKKSLKEALELLDLNGRICVITFHSLEDKICKEIFKSVSTVKEELKNLPVVPQKYMPKYKVIKVLKPSLEEISLNKRSRSAKLRVIERIG